MRPNPVFQTLFFCFNSSELPLQPLLWKAQSSGKSCSFRARVNPWSAAQWMQELPRKTGFRKTGFGPPWSKDSDHMQKNHCGRHGFAIVQGCCRGGWGQSFSLEINTVLALHAVVVESSLSSFQARKMHINMNLLVRLPLGRPQG